MDMLLLLLCYLKAPHCVPCLFFPAPPCPPNSHYSPCVPACRPTCTHLNGPPDCNQNEACLPGCVCNDGFVQKGSVCVPVRECGCVDKNGKKYQVNRTRLLATAFFLRALPIWSAVMIVFFLPVWWRVVYQSLQSEVWVWRRRRGGWDWVWWRRRMRRRRSLPPKSRRRLLLPIHR